MTGHLVPRPWLAVAACLLAIGAAPAPAAAQVPVSCSLDAATHTLFVDAAREKVEVKRSADSLVVRIPEPGSDRVVDCAGPDATVTNTDLIDLSRGLGINVVDLSGGPLAPGFTAEADGSSEIEVETYQGLILVATDGPEQIRVGQVGDDLYVDLDAGRGAEPDILMGGSYHWEIDARGGDDVVDLRGGAGTGAATRYGRVYGGGGNDTLAGPELMGEAGNDTLTGARLAGGDGDDELVAGPEDNSLSGGAGNDVYRITDPGGYDVLTIGRHWGHVSDVVARLDLSVSGPQDTGYGVETIPPGIDEFHGSGHEDVLLGTSGPDKINGQGGADVVDGRGGDDQLSGGGYADFGPDTLVYRDAPAAVNVDLSARRATGGGGTDWIREFEGVVGTRYADVIHGHVWAERLEGGAGADTLYGADQNDTLVPGDSGSGGSDGAADTVHGGRGLDTLSYAGRRWSVAVTLNGLRDDGADPDRDGSSSPAEEGDKETDVERATGGAGHDRLTGSAWDNWLRGGHGNDWIDGGLGRDILEGGAGVDTISYATRTGRVAVRLDGNRNDGADPDGDGFSEPGEENDHVLGAENVTGGSGDDTLVAGRVARGAVNLLTGGPGADFLDALDGTWVTDKLVCGDGADTYRRDRNDTTDGCETLVP